ncbi:hypothetical protein RRG08_014200 [Elysia crispata]|uniref:Uncharacterized protein n=1 Tax=Elysia crispata TaxID=231223 RepID=A0AAE0Z302_9GAST|nr:hypothetical protein RRG08_014200 [Elysia crispata]
MSKNFVHSVVFETKAKYLDFKINLLLLLNARSTGRLETIRIYRQRQVLTALCDHKPKLPVCQFGQRLKALVSSARAILTGLIFSKHGPQSGRPDSCFPERYACSLMELALFRGSERDMQFMPPPSICFMPASPPSPPFFQTQIAHGDVLTKGKSQCPNSVHRAKVTDRLSTAWSATPERSGRDLASMLTFNVCWPGKAWSSEARETLLTTREGAGPREAARKP